MANEKKQPPQKQESYAERNKARVENLLDRDPSGVKAVIANTVETKKIAARLQSIDRIFNNARRNVGYSLSIEDFAKMIEKYTAVTKAIDEMFIEAESLNMYEPYQKRDGKKEKLPLEIHREDIAKLQKDEKDEKEIALKIGESLTVTRKMIKVMKKEADNATALAETAVVTNQATTAETKVAIKPTTKATAAKK